MGNLVCVECCHVLYKSGRVGPTHRCSVALSLTVATEDKAYVKMGLFGASGEEGKHVRDLVPWECP